MTTHRLLSLREKITQIHQSSGSGLCVGIDPRHSLAKRHWYGEGETTHRNPEYLAQWLSEEILAAAIRAKVGSIKLQMAFFECLGASGFKLLADLISQAKREGLFVILDGKRGDISTSMQAYGEMAYDHFGADALTINPFMGAAVWQALEPWLLEGRYAYVLWYTSEYSGGYIQRYGYGRKGGDLAGFLAGHITETAGQCSRALGLVLGATRLSELNRYDEDALKGRSLLIPGMGAQGMTMEDIEGEEGNVYYFGRQLDQLWPLSRGLLRSDEEVTAAAQDDRSHGKRKKVKEKKIASPYRGRLKEILDRRITEWKEELSLV